MPSFNYTAIDATGATASGRIEADGVAHAASQLEAQGLVVHSITKADEPAPSEPLSPELAAAAQRLLDRREEVLPRLTALAREALGRERRSQLKMVLRTLESGDSDEVRVAVNSHPAVWAPLLAAVSDPEESFLSRLSREPFSCGSPQRSRWAVVAYPLIVFLLMLLVLWPIAASVIPIFAKIFGEFGLELPGATLLVISIAGFLTHGGAVVLAALAVAAAVVYTTWSRWHAAIARGPLGHLLPAPKAPDGVVATRGRVAADLLEAGLNTEEAYSLAGLGSVNRAAIQRLTQTRLPAASVPAVLEAFSTCYAEQSTRRSASFAAAAGSVMVVSLGVVVGFAVIALFLPFLRLVEGLS